ncbi:MAG: hypothetical protein M0P99_06375 [Candidatus Cloacimonetes bacterium]|nr:hypothetical protein [Candidatus Cloacimonadota bacterium]
MTTRFFLVIFMLLALFGGWLYVGYESSLSHQAKLEALSKLPIYAYVADTTQVSLILAELKPIQGIKGVIHDTAEQASKELITAYDLPLNENMISDYDFPDVITITLEPTTQALQTKPLILDILRAHVKEADIDSQASAYNAISDELKVANRRIIGFHIFAAILLLLIFVFSRLSFELHTLLLSKGRTHTVVDNIRHRKQGIEHTWAMLLVPLPITLLGYFGFVYFKQMAQLLPYWVFLVQAAAAFVGTLITHFTLHTFEQEVALAEKPVMVINPHAKPTIIETEDEAPDS